MNISSILLSIGLSALIAGCVPSGNCTKVEADGSVSVILDCGKSAANDTGIIDSGDSGTDTDDTGITPVDADGDGHASVETGGDDCDDANVNVYPGAEEACNGDDDDCDGDADEDLVFSNYYVDSDGDGYGAGAASSECEDPGTGFSTSSDDCDDGNAAVHPNAVEDCATTEDLNCDGYAGTSDNDGDGTIACEDCDDGEVLAFPGNHEVCDDIDNDCNAVVDDDALDAGTWYADSDGDAYGDPDTTVAACDAPTGHVGNGDDCDDTDGDINPDTAEVCDGIDNDCDGESDEDSVFTDYYVDSDGDGYGDGVAVNMCEDPGAGYSTVSGDCDDTEASAHPGGTEVCDSDDIDEDCSGVAEDAATGLTTWHSDVDSDGYGSADDTVTQCDAPSGYITTASGYEDCDDSDPAVNVAATEYCNGYDDDCDGEQDEDSAADAGTWYADNDEDGYGDSAVSTVSCECPSKYTSDTSDCDDANGDINPGATEECNGIDENCTGTADDGIPYTTWYADSDGDSYGDAASSVSTCDEEAPEGLTADLTDCDDAEATVHPGAAEIVSDGIDQDCDGADSTEPDADGDGYGESVDCDDGDALVHPGAVETCDGVDEDCDGSADNGLTFESWYDDSDSDGYGDPAIAQSTCDGAPTGTVADDSDCDDSDGAINPGATEACDGADNNCDGDVDESGATGGSTWYADSDEDGFGDAGTSASACDEPSGYVADDTDCDDADGDINPDATEICDGADNDCDSSVDESTTMCADSDGDGCGDISRSTGTLTCADVTTYESYGYEQNCEDPDDYDATDCTP